MVVLVFVFVFVVNLRQSQVHRQPLKGKHPVPDLPPCGLESGRSVTVVVVVVVVVIASAVGKPEQDPGDHIVQVVEGSVIRSDRFPVGFPTSSEEGRRRSRNRRRRRRRSG